MTLSEYLRDCAKNGFRLMNTKVKYNHRVESLDCIQFFKYKDLEISDVYKSTTNNGSFYLINLKKQESSCH